jgi:flagellar basal body-associated protein FliL
MEIVIEIIMKKQFEDTPLETFREQAKQEIISTLNPLLNNGWSIALVNTRINK